MDEQQSSSIAVEDVELERIDLSTRARNCLCNAGITTIGQLAELSAAEVLRWQNAGRKTLHELQEILGRLGLKLSGDATAVGPPDLKLLHELSIPLEQISGETNVIQMDSADPDLQQLLVSRVKDFPLSTRAQNVLVEAKVAYIGELIQLTHSQLRRVHNSGKRTLGELTTFVEDHGLSLGTSIPDWSRDHASALSSLLAKTIANKARERSNDLLGTIAPEPKCLEDELCRIAQALEQGRNANLLIDLWGWSGFNPQTLDSVGRKLGLTRERVRQIEARALRQLSQHGFDVPHFRAAIGFLRKETPGLDYALAKKLSEAGISRSSFSIWSVQKAAEIFGEDWPFQIISSKANRIVVKEGEESLLRKMLADLRQKTSELGCASVTSLLSRSQIDERRRDIVVRFLECTTRAEWLDETKEWLFDRNAARNRLYNLCAKVLSVCPHIRVAELRRAVSKSRRLTMAPPQRILGAFVEHLQLGRINGEMITANAGIAAGPSEDSVEGKMLSVLDEYGPVMDGEEFAERCVAAGINGTSFYIYRLISPVISALGKGVYCKVGSQVPPGTIEDIVSRRKTTARVSDHGWTSAGRLWFGIELTMQIIVAGGIRLAPFVSELAQGEWKVSLPDGTEYGTVMCREMFIWSFRKALAVLGAEPGDLAAFEFDLKMRNVLVRVGGPDLFDYIQDPDGVAAAEAVEEV